MRPPALTFNAWLRWDVVRRRLAELDGVQSVLEVGVGEGALGTRLAAEYDYTGVEPDARSLERARARLAVVGRGQVVQGDVSALDPGKTFDLVCAFEVLEHVEDDLGALRAWRARVRDGGYVLLSVPAYQAQWGAADVKAGHMRRYDPKDLDRVLRGAGFDVVAIDHYGFPLGYVLQTGRNLLARRGQGSPDVAEATAKSGRWLQPPDELGWATKAATWPFRALQRSFARGPRGTGLVALARNAISAAS